MFGFFVVVALLFWFPLPLYLRTGQIEGPPIDPMYNQWILGWGIHALTHYPAQFFESNMFYPFHHTLAWGDHLFSLTIFGLVLKPIFGLVGAYNILLFASTALSGYFSYLLIREVTGSRRAGIVGGLIWCLSHYRTIESGHIQALTTEWIPLLFYFAERLRHHKGTRSALWFTVTTWLMLATNVYMAIFTFLSFVLYALVMILMRAVNVKALARWAWGWMVAGALALPLYIPSIIVNQHRPLDRGYNQDAANLVGFLPWPWPGKVLRKLLHIAHIQTEAPTYHTLGVLTIPLLVIAIIILIKHWKKIREHAFFIFCIILAVFAALAATGPFTRWNDQIVIDHNPFFILPYHFFPGYKVLRSIMRWHFLVMLGVATLAAFGAIPLIKRFTRTWFIALVCLFAIWLLVEQSNAPWHITETYRLQDYPVYSWLRDQPGEFAILELPIFPGVANRQNDIIEARRMYFSTFHWKKRVGGAITPSIPDEYVYNASVINSITDNSQGLRLLQQWNVRYIIFLPDDYDTLGWSGDIRDNTKHWLDTAPDLKSVAQFDQATVYELAKSSGP